MYDGRGGGCHALPPYDPDEPGDTAGRLGERSTGRVHSGPDWYVPRDGGVYRGPRSAGGVQVGRGWYALPFPYGDGFTAP